MKRNNMGRVTSIAPEGSMNAIRSGHGLKHKCLVAPDSQISTLHTPQIRCLPCFPVCWFNPSWVADDEKGLSYESTLEIQVPWRYAHPG